MVSARVAAVVALWLAAIPLAAAARPFTIDDLLHQETLGAEDVDPSGRWMVLERRDPYDTGKRFDGFLQTSAPLTRLFALDLKGTGRLRALLARAPGPGEILVRFSPSGARLAVYRVDGVHVRLGVVTMATGSVRWFDITPEESDWSRGLQWLTDTQLVVIARPGGVPPWTFEMNRVSAERLPRLWAATATGAGGGTVIGSGRYAGVRPHAPPSRLLRVDVRTGRRTTLATGAFFDLEVSPDRRRVALFEAGADLQPRADGPVQGEAGISTRATELSVLDLRAGARRFPCPGRDALPHLLSWSPSGASLLVFTRQPDALWRSGVLQRIDAATGRVEPLAGELAPLITLRPEIVRAGWMGEQPIVLAHPRDAAGARDDWYRLSAAGPVALTKALATVPRLLAAIGPDSFTAVTADGIWRITARGDDVALSQRPAVVVRPPRTTAGTQRADAAPPAGSWVLVGPDGARTLAWLDADRLQPVVAASAAAEPEMIASRPALSALVTERDARGVTVARLLRSGQPALTVATLNPGWAAVDAPVVRAIHHRGPDGQPLTSWLLTPARPGPRPPLIVRPYSGLTQRDPPRDYPGERGLIGSLQMLVGHGYAVLVPSLPLPLEHHDPMAGLADQIGAVIDAAEADPALAGAFDPQRVALWGHSYGGYTVMATIAQTHRYRAAVSIAGLSDFVSKWAAIPPAWRAAPEDGLQNNWSSGSVESGQEGMDAPPWVDPERYLRNSPLYSADRIETPLLLFHGDQDIIPLPQSEAMFSALYRQDKDAMLVTYWGESHMMMNPGNVRDLYARAFAFLDAHLTMDVNSNSGGPGPSRASGPANGAPRPRRSRPRGSPLRATP